MPVVQPQPAPAPETPGALNDLARDLVALARTTDGLQDIIGILVRNAGPTVNSAAIEEIQRLDYVVQRLFAMADQVETLAQGDRAEWAEARRRWRGDNVVTGDCDLF